jgi:hypothetical protein
MRGEFFDCFAKGGTGAKIEKTAERYLDDLKLFGTQTSRTRGVFADDKTLTCTGAEKSGCEALKKRFRTAMPRTRHDLKKTHE